MSKLLRYVPRITAGLVSIIWVIQFVVSTRSSAIGSWFTNPDGTPCVHPCLFGVQPGETTYGEAVDLLRIHPLTRLFVAGRNKGVFNGDGATILIFVGLRDVVVRIDRLQTTDIHGSSAGVLGDVISAFGAPDLIGVGEDYTRTYYLARRTVFLDRHIDVSQLSAEEPLEGVIVYAQQPITTPDLAPWHGFGSVTRYWYKAPILGNICAIAHCYS